MEENKQLRGVPETMLQTLYARARETRTGRNFIRDRKAVEMVEQLDYDFSNAEKDRTMRSGVVARTILLDRMTEQYLREHPGATVVNLACGLDTRCYRMEGLYRRWYNLDLPETMAVRRQFLTQTEQIRQVAGSAMEEAWAEQVEAPEGPVLVLIEGLTMYLKQEDVQQIFQIIRRRFAHATVFVETMSPWIVTHVKEKSIEGSAAKFSWGVKNGAALERLLPGFRSVEDRSLTEGMKVFLPVYRVLGKIGFVRNISNKILVLEQ